VSAALVLRGGVVVPDADGPPLRDGAVVVAAGRVAAVGPAEAIAAAHPGARDGGRFDVLLPGFVDAHSHARGTPLRAHGIGGGPLERFLFELTAMTATDPAEEALLAGADALATGVTATQAIVHTFGDADDYRANALAVVGGLGRSGVRGHVALAITDRGEWFPDDAIAPARGLSPEAFARLAAELIGTRAGRTEIDAAGPVAPQWCSDAALRAVADVGAPRLHAHLLESPAQRRLADGPPARGEVSADPLARLAAAGLLDGRASLAHGVWCEQDEVARLADTGAVVVHCPGSNELIGVGALPARALADGGVRLAFGLDSHTPSDPVDLFEELRRARALAAGRGAPIAPREALAMALAGGAAALCRDDVGRLASGARADVVALALPAAAAAADPVAAVVEHASRDAVARVWVDGDVAWPPSAETAAACVQARARVRDALRRDASARADRLAVARRRFAAAAEADGAPDRRRSDDVVVDEAR
jgi:cytosine/adenosine deaminase-related metal-dependent hydrolase